MPSGNLILDVNFLVYIYIYINCKIPFSNGDDSVGSIIYVSSVDCRESWKLTDYPQLAATYCKKLRLYRRVGSKDNSTSEEEIGEFWFSCIILMYR